MRATITTSELKRLIKSMKKFVADDGHNKLMPFIKITVSDGTLTGVALDGHRIAREKISCMSDCDFDCYIKPIIPVLKGCEYSTIELIDNYAYITAGDNRTGFKQPEGEYYKTSDYFEKEKYQSFAIGFNSKYLKEALESMDGKVVLRFSNPKEPVYIYNTGKKVVQERVVLPISIGYED